MEDWTSYWKSQQYVDDKMEKINKLKSHIKNNPKNILDIGCGPAIESEFFQKIYDSYLYLLDGNPKPNKNRNVGFGSVDTFNFYHDVEIIKKDYDSRNLKYTFLDITEGINIPQITFDFVYSFLSCGFHYPVSEYVSTLKRHTDENTLIMFDIRRETFLEQMKNFKEYEIIYSENKKYYTVKVKI